MQNLLSVCHILTYMISNTKFFVALYLTRLQPEICPIVLASSWDGLWEKAILMADFFFLDYLKAELVTAEYKKVNL